MLNVSEFCGLAVVVYCRKCNLILYRDVRQVYQTKGGRWQKSITILKNDIDSHRECRKQDLEPV